MTSETPEHRSFADIIREMRTNDHFDAWMDQLIQQAVLETELADYEVLRTPSTDRFSVALVNLIPSFEAALKQEVPDSDPGDLFREAVLAAVERAFDLGFRVGRAFNAQGNELQA